MSAIFSKTATSNSTAGLRKRATYEELIAYIKEDPDTIRYPNRDATLMADSYVYNQLIGEGFRQMSMMSNQSYDESKKEALLRSFASSSKMDLGKLKAIMGAYGIEPVEVPMGSNSSLLRELPDLMARLNMSTSPPVSSTTPAPTTGASPAPTTGASLRGGSKVDPPVRPTEYKPPLRGFYKKAEGPDVTVGDMTEEDERAFAEAEDFTEPPPKKEMKKDYDVGPNRTAGNTTNSTFTADEGPFKRESEGPEANHTEGAKDTPDEDDGSRTVATLAFLQNHPELVFLGLGAAGLALGAAGPILGASAATAELAGLLGGVFVNTGAAQAAGNVAGHVADTVAPGTGGIVNMGAQAALQGFSPVGLRNLVMGRLGAAAVRRVAQAGVHMTVEEAAAMYDGFDRPEIIPRELQTGRFAAAEDVYARYEAPQYPEEVLNAAPQTPQYPEEVLNAAPQTPPTDTLRPDQLRTRRPAAEVMAEDPDWVDRMTRMGRTPRAYDIEAVRAANTGASSGGAPAPGAGVMGMFNVQEIQEFFHGRPFHANVVARMYDHLHGRRGAAAAVGDAIANVGFRLNPLSFVRRMGLVETVVDRMAEGRQLNVVDNIRREGILREMSLQAVRDAGARVVRQGIASLNTRWVAPSLMRTLRGRAREGAMRGAQRAHRALVAIEAGRIEEAQIAAAEAEVAVARAEHIRTLRENWQAARGRTNEAVERYQQAVRARQELERDIQRRRPGTIATRWGLMQAAGFPVNPEVVREGIDPTAIFNRINVNRLNFGHRGPGAFAP